MNSYKLNSTSGHAARFAICKGLGIDFPDLYKEVKILAPNGKLKTKDGKVYELKLIEVKE